MIQLARLAFGLLIVSVGVAACGKKDELAKRESDKALTAAPAEIVKIGLAARLTGGIAHLGNKENGARLAIDEINAAGGLKIGEKTFRPELVDEDDKADSKEGLGLDVRFLALYRTGDNVGI